MYCGFSPNGCVTTRMFYPQLLMIGFGILDCRIPTKDTSIMRSVVESGSSKEEYSVHVESHFEHRCSYCSYSSRTEGRLRRHVREFHGSPPDDVILETNTASVTFDHHQQQQHQQQRLIKCRQCPFSTRIRVIDVVGSLWHTISGGEHKVFEGGANQTSAIHKH